MSSHLVLGLGGTVDYEIVWDSAVLEELILEHGISAGDLTMSQPIDDERALVLTVLAFLERGAGGERFAASSGIVEAFAARFETRVTLGGTGVRAGIAMHSLGVPSVQHLVSIDDTVRRLLPDSTTFISSATEDTLDPHLIVQFSAGTRVTAGDIDIVAPHANRLIVANDPPNRELRISADLAAALSEARAFLVSGFNTMQDRALLDARLHDVRVALSELPTDALVFYEDAGFYNPEFSTRVRRALLDQIDVYSLNEDELQTYLGSPVNLLNPDAVVAALEHAHRLIPARVLLVHTRHWAIALGDRAPSFAPALEGAVTMAATRYRQGDGHTAADYAQTRTLPVQTEGAAVAAAVQARLPHRAAAVPAYRLDVDSPTTIGLGDSFVGGFLAAWATTPADVRV